jgi:hypothetical protein
MEFDLKRGEFVWKITYSNYLNRPATDPIDRQVDDAVAPNAARPGKIDEFKDAAQVVFDRAAKPRAVASDFTSRTWR